MMELTEMGRREAQTEEMVPLLKRHEIQVLRRAGHSQADVAERTGVGLKTVRRIDRESDVAHVDDAAVRRERKIGRPSKATAFAPKVAAWLASEAQLPTQELLRRANEADDRHIRRRAMVFTTNKHPRRWGDVLHDDDLAEAIVDRIPESAASARRTFRPHEASARRRTQS